MAIQIAPDGMSPSGYAPSGYDPSFAGPSGPPYLYALLGYDPGGYGLAYYDPDGADSPAEPLPPDFMTALFAWLSSNSTIVAAFPGGIVQGLIPLDWTYDLDDGGPPRMPVLSYARISSIEERVFTGGPLSTVEIQFTLHGLGDSQVNAAGNVLMAQLRRIKSPSRLVFEGGDASMQSVGTQIQYQDPDASPGARPIWLRIMTFYFRLGYLAEFPGDEDED